MPRALTRHQPAISSLSGKAFAAACDPAMPQNRAPITCVSVVVCDDGFRDQGSGKLALWGTFNSVSAPAVPCTHPRLCVFASITNGRGTRDVRISIERATDSEPVIQIAGPMRFTGPLEIVDISIVLNGVVFSEFGKYWVCEIGRASCREGG